MPTTAKASVAVLGLTDPAADLPARTSRRRRPAPRSRPGWWGSARSSATCRQAPGTDTSRGHGRDRAAGAGRSPAAAPTGAAWPGVGTPVPDSRVVSSRAVAIAPSALSPPGGLVVVGEAGVDQRLRLELGDHERVGGVLLVARADHGGGDRDHREQQRAEAEHPAGARGRAGWCRAATGGGSSVGLPQRGAGGRPRPKRVNTTAQQHRGHQRDPDRDGREHPAAGRRGRRPGATAQPPTSRIGLEQGRGRGGRGDAGGHQDDAGERDRLDDVGPAYDARRRPAARSPATSARRRPDLAGQPRQQVGQRDQRDADRDQQRELSARASGVASRAVRAPRRTSWASPPPSLRSLREHRRRGVGPGDHDGPGVGHACRQRRAAPAAGRAGCRRGRGTAPRRRRRRRRTAVAVAVDALDTLGRSRTSRVVSACSPGRPRTDRRRGAETSGPCRWRRTSGVGDQVLGPGDHPAYVEGSGAGDGQRQQRAPDAAARAAARWPQPSPVDRHAGGQRVAASLR